MPPNFRNDNTKRLQIFQDFDKKSDVSVQVEILTLLTDLRSEQKLTYVMVSHYLSVVGHMCEQLAIMKDGEIVEIMDVETLINAQARHSYSQELLAASI